MDLGLVIYGSLDSLTGGYIYDRILVDYLRQCGHRVDIISLAPGPYSRHLLDYFSPVLRSNLLNSDCDVLLQDELSHPSLCRINHLLQRKTNSPIVAIVHQVLCRQPRCRFLNRLYETVEKTYLNSVDAFIFNSKTTRRNVEQLIRGRRPSIVASPSGDRLGSLALTDRIGSRALAPGPLELIFVGNVLPNKGLLPLIQDLSKLPFEIWHLTVVGSLDMNRRYHRKVEKLIVSKKMERQVVLVGPRKGPDMASLLARAHVFVMPYSYEGFGMAHLEAMAYALPVIGSSSGAVKEYVIPEVNGFLIEPGDYKAVLESINGLHLDRLRLTKMSRAALQTFHGSPKWKDTTDAIERFLHDLCRHGRMGGI